MPSKLRLIGTINLQQQQMILPLENVMNSWFSVLLLAREPIFVLNDMRSQQILSIRGGQGSPDVKTLNSNASYIMRLSDYYAASATLLLRYLYVFRFIEETNTLLLWKGTKYTQQIQMVLCCCCCCYFYLVV